MVLRRSRGSGSGRSCDVYPLVRTPAESATEKFAMDPMERSNPSPTLADPRHCASTTGMRRPLNTQRSYGRFTAT